MVRIDWTPEIARLYSPVVAAQVSQELDALLVSDSFFQDPYPVYRQLRERDPVHWCEPWGQWVVSRFDDVLAVNKDPARFSSFGWERKFTAQFPDLPHLQRHYATSVLSMTDPPEHTRLRRLVVRSFTPRVLEAMRPRIEALVEELLDRLDGRSEADLIAEFAYPLPAIVIGELLGAPEVGRERFIEWSADVVAVVGTGSVDPERARRADRTLAEFRAFLEPVIADRRRHPREDLMSLLSRPDENGEQLTDDELVSTCIVLLFAGHETTANLIGNGLLALLRHPAELELLRAEPDLVPSAVEELLRYDSPVQRNRRLATGDVEFGDKTIHEGDSVLAFLGAANRDPERFESPDALDLRRSPNHHQAFGYGIHFCVGAALSRIEGPIAITRLLSRFPGLRLAAGVQPRWRQNIVFRGLESLELELT